jgi:hypothetical protein
MRLINFLKSKFRQGKVASFLRWVWKDVEAGDFKAAEKKVVDEVKETISEGKTLG